MEFEIPKSFLCFYMHLKRTVLIFGCIGMVLSAVTIVVFNYIVENCKEIICPNSITVIKPAEIVFILAVYCVQFLANVVLIYAAHNKIVLCLKVFYFFTLCTVGVIVIFEIVVCFQLNIRLITTHLMVLSFAVICCQAYLLTLVRSLYIELEKSDTHQPGNEPPEIVMDESEMHSDVSNNETDKRRNDTSCLQDADISCQTILH